MNLSPFNIRTRHPWHFLASFTFGPLVLFRFARYCFPTWTAYSFNLFGHCRTFRVER